MAYTHGSLDSQALPRQWLLLFDRRGQRGGRIGTLYDVQQQVVSTPPIPIATRPHDLDIPPYDSLAPPIDDGDGDDDDDDNDDDNDDDESYGEACGGIWDTGHIIGRVTWGYPN